jgi:hypothetical protein
MAAGMEEVVGVAAEVMVGSLKGVNAGSDPFSRSHGHKS